MEVKESLTPSCVVVHFLYEYNKVDVSFFQVYGLVVYAYKKTMSCRMGEA
jgi:hypothetical protein